MMPTLIEAALRSLILALAVWAGLRIFRVRNVVAQKVAWGLVLAAATFMPILAPWLGRVLPAGASITVPVHAVVPAYHEPASATLAEPDVDRVQSAISPSTVL